MKCNKATLADILSIGLTTVDARVREGMPYINRPGENGSKEWLFDTAEVIEWIADGRGQPEEQRDEMAEAKLQQVKAESGLKWMEFGEKLGHLINIEDIVERVEAGDAIVKSRIMAVPGRLAQTLAVESDPAKVQALIKAELNEALAELNKDWAERG